jgi:hypothetical protein
MRGVDLEDVRMQKHDWLITYTRLDGTKEKKWAIKANTYSAIAKAMKRFDHIIGGADWSDASWGLLGSKSYKFPKSIHTYTGLREVSIEVMEERKRASEEQAVA